MLISGSGISAKIGLNGSLSKNLPATNREHSAKMAYLTAKNDIENFIPSFSRAMKVEDSATVNAADVPHGQKNSPEYSRNHNGGRNYNGPYDTLMRQIRYARTESPKIDVYC